MKTWFSSILAYFRELKNSTDNVFFIFLLLILNIKLPVKLLGILFIYIFRFNFKFGISLGKNSRLPIFYFLMVLLCLLELLLVRNFSSNYLTLFAFCITVWVICFLVIHQIKLSIEKSGREKVENGIRLFFIVNALMSLVNLVLMMLDAKSINPYTFEGLSYKYFTSTGDYIRGILFDLSTTNMIVNAMGLFYFLYRQRYIMSSLCMVIIFLATSNLGNMILIAFLFLAFLINRDRLFRSVVLCYLSALVIFIVKISPANLDYLTGSYKDATQKQTATNVSQNERRTPDKDSLLRVFIVSRNKTTSSTETLSPVEIRKIETDKEIGLIMVKRKENIVMTDKNFDEYSKNAHERMIAYTKKLYGDSLTASDIEMPQKKLPGKLIAFKETFQYLARSIKNFVFGSGPGNFSSKFGFRALGLNTDGSWIKGKEYMSEDFKQNHLKVWLYYQIQPPAKHSVLNAPNSAVNQLAGEYGLVGMILFLLFYVWFFAKRFKILSYGRILLPLILTFLFTDYWFENLSVFIIFETLMLIDLDRKEEEVV